MTELEINKAMDVLLSVTVTGFGWRVAWPNCEFEPDDEPYVMVSFMPATTWTASLQNKGLIFRGVYQAMIVAKPGSGSQLLRQRAAEIAQVFESQMLPNGDTGVSGLRVNAEGDEVYLTGPATIGAGFNTDYGYNVPISLNYRADS